MKVGKLIRHGLLLWRKACSDRVRSLCFVCLAVLMAWLSQNTVGSASDAPKRRSILFLFPQATSVPAYDILYDGVRNSIYEHLGEPLDIYAEYLDRERFPDESYQNRFFDLLCDKYKNKPIDLWIGIGHGMAELIDRSGKDLLHEVPAVLMGYQDPVRGAPFPEDRPRTTGVVADLDIKKTLDLAVSLQPETRKAFVVSGASPSDRWFEKVSRVALREYESRGELVYLTGLSTDEVVGQMEKLPPRSVVLFLQFNSDRNGDAFYSRDIIRIISETSDAPIYSLFSQQVGAGVVGGTMIDIQRAAEKAGELAARVLRGERPESIPIVRDDLLKTMFDWRQLKRHGIAENRLPEGSLVLYKELGVFEKYRWIVVGVITFILCQTILLVLLVRTNRNQKWTQKKLIEAESRYRQLLHLDRLSRLGQVTASLAHELNQPLSAILTTAQAGLRFLSAEQKDFALLRRIMENIVRDDKRAAGVVTNLRSMLGREKHLVEPVDLNVLLEEVVSILQGEAMLRKVAIERNLAESLPSITASPVTLRQVILNLLMNAFDAISLNPEDRRKVILQTKLVDGWVQVAVRDSGPGIQAEHPEQLFQPFYTTKGSGMGMGLAICNTIVKDHGGRIWAENAPGGGACFTFTLPVPQHEHEKNVYLH